MKQIYNHIKQWKFIDKKDIHDTSIFRHFTLLEAENFIEYLKERGIQNEHIIF